MRSLLPVLGCLMIALVFTSSCFGQCGVSQSVGLSPVVSGQNIQGCSVGQRINVRTNSQALAQSSLPPLQLNLPNPQVQPNTRASQPAVQQPAPSDAQEEPAEEPVPQESRRRQPATYTSFDKSLMALSAPSREQRRVAGTALELIVKGRSPSQDKLTNVLQR